MGKPVQKKKKKKKGRPSLLDLQKRSLRLQKQQQQQEEQHERQQQKNNRNPNPSPNPYLRFPNSSTTPHRRSTRRNPNPDADGDRYGEDNDDDDDEESSGKRREKKLKFVLRIQGNDAGATNRSELVSSGSESNGDGESPLRKRMIDAVGKSERQNSALKATDPLGGEPSDSGPTTALPDKKLLVFILDRLQKKDIYGVFAEPVDPEELPDYHEVIEHPMDFGTVRKRLSSGYYANLEQFEIDVFLICSNAMRYNAPDTIYFRQARSIQELAKKNFENLRQESDDNEAEPKIVRRGRPPSTLKRSVGRPPAERAGSDFSDATLANAGDNTHCNSSIDLSRKGSASDKTSADVSARSNYGLRIIESFSWMAEHKSERNEDFPASTKGISTRFGRKVSVSEENRRNTYKEFRPSTSGREPSVLMTFDGERKLLVPVGLHVEHAYARSLARFAANLGPIGWNIAAKQIEKVLPPGTKFGRGWVGEPDAPQLCQPPHLSTSAPPPSCRSQTAPSSMRSRSEAVPDGRLEPPSSNMAVEEGRVKRSTCLPVASSSLVSNRSSNPMDNTESTRELTRESGFSPTGGGSCGSIWPKTPPFQLHQNMSTNGLNPAFGFNLSQAGKMIRPLRPMGNLVSEMPTTHDGVLDMVSRGNNSIVHPSMPAASHLETMKRPNSGNPGMVNPVSPLPDSTQGSWRGTSLHQKPDSSPPDLNVRFQSPGSPASAGMMVDPPQQPDLALQL